MTISHLSDRTVDLVMRRVISVDDMPKVVRRSLVRLSGAAGFM
jgi:hypothetical protein